MTNPNFPNIGKALLCTEFLPVYLHQIKKYGRNLVEKEKTKINFSDAFHIPFSEL